MSALQNWLLGKGVHLLLLQDATLGPAEDDPALHLQGAAVLPEGDPLAGLQDAR